MKIGSPEFVGKITVNGTDYTLDWFAHILNNAMAYYDQKTYNIGDFVSYNNKWYYSIVNNNKNHLPTNINYWNEYFAGNEIGGIANEEITTNITAELQKRYIVTNPSGVVITLPEGEETKTIAISAQSLNSNAVITIRPASGETIGEDNSLIIDASYASVELVFLDGDWHIITPFMPQAISNSITILPGIVTDYNSSTKLATARPVDIATNQWAGDNITNLWFDWSNPDEN